MRANSKLLAFSLDLEDLVGHPLGLRLQDRIYTQQSSGEARTLRFYSTYTERKTLP